MYISILKLFLKKKPVRKSIKKMPITLINVFCIFRKLHRHPQIFEFIILFSEYDQYYRNIKLMYTNTVTILKSIYIIHLTI